jgi:hypothetical protein
MDSKESILPAYVARRADTPNSVNSVVVPARQTIPRVLSGELGFSTSSFRLSKKLHHSSALKK